MNPRISTFCVVTIGACMLGLGALAQDKNAAQPTDFSAENVVFYEADNRVTLTDNATVSGAAFELNAGEITVFLNVDDVGTRSVDHIEAVGDVAAQIQGAETTADSASYQADARVVIFVGNVVSTRGGSVITGDRLEAEIDTGIYRVIGGVKGTISGSF